MKMYNVCDFRFPAQSDPCSSYPCQNGGTCVMSDGIHACHCPSPYVEPDCICKLYSDIEDI